MLLKGLQSDADCLILDLEDSISPSEKGNSREIIRNWLETVDFGEKIVVVRMNSTDTDWSESDIEACLEFPPDAFLIPKVESLRELKRIDKLIVRHARTNEKDAKSVGFFLLTQETPLGVINITQLHQSPRLTAITWGAEDLMSAIGGTANRDVHRRFYPLYESCRNNTLLAAAAAQVAAIDTVYVDLDDGEGLQSECEYVKKLGFTGKLTIHPNQIPIVNDVFTPSFDEVAQATRLVEAFADARTKGLNAIRFEGRMVDTPHLHQAERLLRRAKHFGQI